MISAPPFRIHLPQGASRRRTIAQRGYEAAVNQLNAAKTPEEMSEALELVERKKRTYGAILLSGDRMARPEIYDKGRRALRAACRH